MKKNYFITLLLIASNVHCFNVQAINYLRNTTINSVSPAIEITAVQYRPPLFFREDWKETPPATPVTQEHVANKDLILTLYGPGKDGIRKSNHEQPIDDPFYIWSGMAEGNWAVSLRHATNNVDLRGPSHIRWRARQAGFRVLRPIIKLASGECIYVSQPYASKTEVESYIQKWAQQQGVKAVVYDGTYSWYYPCPLENADKICVIVVSLPEREVII